MLQLRSTLQAWLFAGLALVTALSSCSLSRGNHTRQSTYGKMYSEAPRAILLMPPINLTNQVELKENFYPTLLSPLAERGYYVFSPFLTQELLQQEGVHDGETLFEGNLTPFARVFGADAALFTVIHRWEKQALTSSIAFDIEYRLRSVKTGEDLFARRVAGDLSLSSSEGSGGIFGALGQLVSDILTTALTDKVIAARLANREILQDLPAGPYHPNYQLDQKTQVDAPHKTGVRFRSRN